MSSQRASQLVEAGLWLRLSGDPEGARRLFEQALRLDPTNARARQLLDVASPAQTTLPPAPPPPTDAKPPAFHNPFQRQGAVPPIDPMEMDWGVVAANDARDTGTSSLESMDTVEFTSDASSAWDSKSNPGLHISNVSPGVGSAMDLIALDDASGDKDSGDAVREEVQTLLRGAKDLVELDDHTGAMDLIAKAQELAPHDPRVQSMREKSERTLQNMLESKLGKLDAMPRVTLKEDEITWLNLDHRAGFVLAQIDGSITFEDLFAVSGMSRLDTARILAQLVEEGVIDRGS